MAIVASRNREWPVFGNNGYDANRFLKVHYLKVFLIKKHDLLKVGHSWKCLCGVCLCGVFV